MGRHRKISRGMGEKKEEWREREGGREQGEREIEKETYIHINGMLAA